MLSTPWEDYIPVLETFQTSFKPMLLPNASSLLPMLLSAHAKKLGYHHSVLSLSFRNLNFIYVNSSLSLKYILRMSFERSQ